MNKALDIPQGRPFFPMPPAPRKYTAADIFFFLEAGLLDDSAKFELLDGEIIPKQDRGITPMSPKGNHHEVMRERLMLWLSKPWRNKFVLRSSIRSKSTIVRSLNPTSSFTIWLHA